jgi:hypothetical protein
MFMVVVITHSYTSQSPAWLRIFIFVTSRTEEPQEHAGHPLHRASQPLSCFPQQLEMDTKSNTSSFAHKLPFQSDPDYYSGTQQLCSSYRMSRSRQTLEPSWSKHILRLR